MQITWGEGEEGGVGNSLSIVCIIRSRIGRVDNKIHKVLQLLCGS